MKKKKKTERESVRHNSRLLLSIQKLTEKLYLVSLASSQFHYTKHKNKTLFPISHTQHITTHSLSLFLLLIPFRSPTPNQTLTNTPLFFLSFFFSPFSHSAIRPWRLLFKRRRFGSYHHHQSLPRL